ncbi:MAG TPA: hypothetical protein ENL10_02785 [Candidatus Cloacimonetes bacterium]|nr:hypothetical protein [Candidatus Cloacimonadota bacterium]
MKKSVVVAIVCTLLLVTVGTARADTYQNQAITELRAVFTGTSDNITLIVYADFNDAAKSQGDLKIKITIDSTVIGEDYTVTDLLNGVEIEWDESTFTGDAHTITVEFVNPKEDVSTANTADNKLSLLIASPTSTIAALINLWGQVEYTVSKVARQTGYLAFIAEYPLWIWIVVILIIIAIIVLWRRAKKGGKKPTTQFRQIIKL